ncbi:MAG: type II secretion system protein GspM [Enterobacteriaceae bacterium]
MFDRIQQLWNQHFWNQYSARERYLVLSCLLLLVVVIFWYGLLSPLLDYRSSWEQQRVQAEQSLRWMQRNQGVLSQLEGNQTERKMKNSTLEQIIGESAQQNGIINPHIVTGAVGTTEVQLSDVSFNTLLTWLQQLEQQFAVQVQSATLVESGKHDGTVTSVKLQLVRKGH